MNSTRAKYKAQSLCVKCGGMRDVTGRLHCAKCLASGRAAEKRSYHKYRETRRTYHRKWKKVNSVELKAAAYRAYGGNMEQAAPYVMLALLWFKREENTCQTTNSAPKTTVIS